MNVTKPSTVQGREPVSVIGRHEGGILPISSRPWNATRRHELQFVEELRSASDGVPGTHRRSDLTALMNGLRTGLEFGEFIQQVPGIDPRAMVAAYNDVDAALRSSVAAVRLILEAEHTSLGDELLAPSPELVAAAAVLSPGMIGHIMDVASSVPCEEAVAHVRHVARRCSAVSSCFVRLERALEEACDEEWLPGRIERLLDLRCGTMQRDEFLPPRVGALTSTRLDRIYCWMRCDVGAVA